jgi:hypothetical protein
MDTPWVHSDSPSLRSTGQNLCHLRTLDQPEPTPPESLLRTLLPEYRARGGVRISPPFAPAVGGSVITLLDNSRTTRFSGYLQHGLVPILDNQLRECGTMSRLLVLPSRLG